MTDDINKKISIDIEVNTDGQQQIDQYKASFDSLRNAVNNLDRPLQNISTNINTLDKNVAKITHSVSKLNSQNQTLKISGKDVADSVVSLSETFLIWQKAINFVKIGVVSLQEALTGGLAILTVFGPEIIDWVSSLFSADTTVKSLTQSLSDQKLAHQAVTQARLQGDLNAQQELVHLKLLYSASQDQNLSLTERKKAVNELQSQYPGYFDHLFNLLELC